MTRSLMCMLAVTVALMPMAALAADSAPVTPPAATPVATPAVTPAATPAAAPEAAPAAAPTGTPAATPAAAPTPNLTPVAPEKETPGATPGATPAAGVTGSSTAGAKDGGKPPNQSPCAFFGGDPTIPIIVMVGILLMYVWMGRSRRKQEKARKNLLSSLKKGDKITTIGGIVGTVIEVRDNEVTVKTDESNNVRMKFARWAIRDVGETGKAGPQDQGQAPEKK